ncbi:MAG: hypothetical protein AAF841_01595 [Pseudomonadota bacterium]
MKHLTLLLAFVALASCGADGEPVRPFGTAGISVGSGGVTTNASVGARTGPVTIAVGF